MNNVLQTFTEEELQSFTKDTLQKLKDETKNKKCQNEIIMVQPEKIKVTFDCSGKEPVISECSITPKRPENKSLYKRKSNIKAKKTSAIDTFIEKFENNYGETIIRTDENIPITEIFRKTDKYKAYGEDDSIFVTDQYLVGVVKNIKESKTNKNSNSCVKTFKVGINILPANFGDTLGNREQNSNFLHFEESEISVIEDDMGYLLETKICFLKVDYKIQKDNLNVNKLVPVIKDVYPLTRDGFKSLQWLVSKSILNMYDDINSSKLPFEFAMILYRLIERHEDGINIRYITIPTGRLKPIVAVIDSKKAFSKPSDGICKFIDELSRWGGTVPELTSRDNGTLKSSLSFYIPEDLTGRNKYNAMINFTISVFPQERNTYKILMPIGKDNEYCCVIEKKSVSAKAILDEYSVFIKKYEELLKDRKKFNYYISKDEDLFKMLKKILGTKAAKDFKRSFFGTKQEIFLDFVKNVREANKNTDCPDLYTAFLDILYNDKEV